MEIKIIRNSNSILLDHVRALIKFKRENKPWTSTVFPILSLFVGIMTVIICFVYYKIGAPFWNPQSVLGIILILVAVIIYLSNYIQKQDLIAGTKQAIKEYEKHKNITEIVLTESMIQIKDFQSYHELKWSAFKNVNISKDHFFFMMDKYYVNGIVINKSELTETEVQQLINFIQEFKNSQPRQQKQ